MLEICKASAGSGKTFRLTQRYLEMLLMSGMPEKYKSILAVTFTNKATSEMKKRILDELYKLSTGLGASPYRKDLCGNEKILRNASFAGLPVEDYISQTAGKYLIAILNDYSLFGVSTIDRFFQQVMRAFARELGHYPSYNVELDSKSVLQFAIDNLMNSLEENRPVLDWLIRLSLENIRKGKDWNSVPRLSALGGELFSEEYKIAMMKADEDNLDREAVEIFRRRLEDEMDVYRESLLSLREKAVAILDRCGLQSGDFKGGSRSFMTYVTDKIRPSDRFIVKYTPTFRKAAEGGVESWYSGTSKLKNEICEAYGSGLGEIVSEMADEEKRRRYDTCHVILANITTMGVLGDIAHEIRRYCRDNNLLLISDTPAFLSRILNGSNTPFIYEKVGVRIENYLLDEFQDTSRLQWNNFRSLIEESLASGHHSLVVGDVKQSIYRWRGSDWNLLYSEIAEQFSRWPVSSVSLKFNWRSSLNVIRFNNGLFTKTPPELGDEKMTDFYTDSEQEIPQTAGRSDGHVKVRFFPCASEMFSDEAVCHEILADLQRLTENGYRPGDIAFLVRTNSQGEALARLLISSGYNVMTEESLKISSSVAVRHIVNLLKMMNDPENVIVRYMENSGDGSMSRAVFASEETSLYNLCEDIIRRLSEEEQREVPFIQAFLDAVSDFISLDGSDLNRFLKWWDEVGMKRSISAPEGDGSIRILTIHKSKGLEFKVAVIPFLDEPFSGGKDASMMWCPLEEPGNGVRVVPLVCNRDLQDTDFADLYEEEMRSRTIDAFNLTYVAFTRAVDELIVYSRVRFDKTGACPMNSMGHVLYNHLSAVLNGEMVYESGNWTRKEAEEGSGNVPAVNGCFVSIPIGDRLSLTLSGGEFFGNEVGMERMDSRRRGIVLHNILASVEVEEDLGRAIDRAVAEGDLRRSDRSCVEDTLREMIVSVRDRHWFDGRYELLNETSILTPEHREYRPDRVMIAGTSAIVVDYKFGKVHSAGYEEQVRSYMTLLGRMGFTDVKGFLWYVGKIEEV